MSALTELVAKWEDDIRQSFDHNTDRAYIIAECLEYLRAALAAPRTEAANG